MIIRLWRGYHSSELMTEIKRAWQGSDHLLIVCPPLLRDFSFVNCLPPGEIRFCGDWGGVATESVRVSLEFSSFQPLVSDFSSRPVLGVFTSGTLSGHPRLVLYSKENLESSVASVSAQYDLNRVDRIFCYPQPFHTFGLVLGYVMAFLKGKELSTPQGRYDRKAHDLRLSFQDPNLLTLGTPTHFLDLIDELQTSGRAIAPSYSCNIGGAPVTVALWQKIQSVLQIEQPSIGYGCTEASPGISHHPPGQKPLEDFEIGYPLPSLQSSIDPRQGVTIQGPSLCLAMIEKGKLQFPKTLTIRDSLRERPDGMWVFEGRLDLMLNRGGQKFSLEAMEQTLLAKTGLRVCALAVPHARFGQDLAMLVMESEKGAGACARGCAGKSPELPGETVNLDRISELTVNMNLINSVLKTEFSIQMNPDSVVMVREFPMNSSFKIDRRAALQLFKDESYDHSAKIS